ncbi:oligosaccharide flippase family protein [Thermodesulfobacteriota bacterium]
MSDTQEDKIYSASGALIWTYSGMAVKIVCQFGFGIAIARILGPEPYGLVAASTIIISLCSLLADSGISAAVIHHQDASDQEIAGAFWIQFVIAWGICLAIIVMAPFFVRWLNAPSAELVLQISGLAFPLNAIAIISMALLRRQLNMRIIQIAMIISYLAAYGIVGLTLAINDFGVWALVFSQLTQIGLNAVIVYAAVRPPLRHPIWPGRIISFGGWTVLSNFASWAHANLMRVFLTRTFGIIAMGQFNRLALISESTVSIIGSPLQQVLFPALSRAAEEPYRQKLIMRCSMRLLGLVYLPAMLIMFVFPEQVVEGVLGSKFIDNAVILRPLAIATIGLVWITTTGSFFLGHGQPRSQWFVQFSTLPVTLCVLWIFSDHTLLIFCWGFCLSIWFRAIISLLTVLYKRILTIRDVVIGFGPAILPTLSGFGGAWAGFALTIDNTPEFRLFLSLPLAVICWGAIIMLSGNCIVPQEIRDKIVKFRNKI